MNRFLFLIIFIFFSLVGKAQSFWAQGIGGGNVDETMDICKDNVGNIISTGYFTNTATFGTVNPLTSASIGIPDIYVSKSNPSGVIQWAIRAGGLGSDRALSVKTDVAGNIYITGFYYGSATFGTFTLSSINGSQDIFIAKLNSSGTFIWAISAGGTMADIGNAIDIDINGNVLLTGQFQGIASFGGSILTSMVNPQSTLYSIDIFTAKYDNNGSFLWVKQGKAKYTDRGLDIASDANGNIFVCGQFSDTIVFNSTHNNPVMNAIFLIKYDAAGNEIWFHKASGTYSIAYSLTINSNNDIYMVGDFQGTLCFFGPPNNFLSDTYTNCIYIVKYNNNGGFIWAKSESSNNYISSRAVALDLNQDPYIAGEYGCTLNKFADVFGQGTFNSVGFQDILAVKYTSLTGQRQWMRNFGGPGNDKAHGILVNIVDNPIIAGSYEKKISMAVNSLTVTTNNSLNVGSGNTSYCSDASYGNFRGMSCSGFSDGFIIQAIDITRQPYDYYHRSNNSCLRSFVGGCVDNSLSFTCPDTLTFCGNGTLYANTFTGSGLASSVGPDYRFLWSSSPLDTLYTKNVTISNYYRVKMTTADGCYTSFDSAYALVHPIPQAPTITDDHGINNQQPQYGNQILVCAPNVITLTAGNINGNSLSWYKSSSCFSGGTFITNNVSFATSTSGYYNNVLINQYGCTNYNCVKIQIDSLLPQLIPKSLIPDTLTACQGDPVTLNVIDMITGMSSPFYSLNNTWSSSPSISIGPISSFSLSGLLTAQTSGTYFVTENIVYINNCDTNTYTVKDTFYLLVHPKPTVAVAISGPSYVCAGDTIILHIVNTPSTYVNTLIVPTPLIDSIIVTQPGTYAASAIITDTTSGCGSSNSAAHLVQSYPDPVISMVPFSGLICPNDSVHINCNMIGINYQWIGPNGILPYNTQSIYQSVPGFYHCIVTNTVGCVLASNTVELKQYNTPFLLASPSNIVCFGQSITLQVITNDATLIVWDAPLSGGGATKIVNQSGTYSCSVTMCGITTLCSITVTVSQPVAQISGPISVCPADSVLLIANTGMVGYQWSPINVYNDSVYVPAGTYLLTTTDQNGCTATATKIVALDTSVARPLSHDSTLCAGNSTTLVATGIGQIEWFTSPTATIPIHVGNSFTTPLLFAQTIYYISTSNSNGCHSLRNPVKVFITTTSLPPLVSHTFVCTDSNIIFSTPTQQNATYAWTGPNGFSSALQNPVIMHATSVNAGVYLLTVSGGSCVSPQVSDTVLIFTPTIAQISGPTTVCSGDSVLLKANSGMMSYQWSPITSNYDSVIVPAGIYSVVITDMNGCVSSDTTTITTDTSYTIPSSNDTTACAGTSTTLIATGIGQIQWFTSFGSTTPIYTGSTFVTPTIVTPTTTFYVQTSGSGGCNSLRDSVKVFAPSTSFPPDISVTTLVCNGGSIIFSTPTQQNATYSWTGPNGFASVQQNPIIANASAVNSGIYTLTVSGQGCTSPPVSDTVLVIELATPILLGNDTVCARDSISLLITNSDTSAIYYWNGPQGFSSTGISITIFPADTLNSGTYTVYGSVNGCLSNDSSFTVFVKPAGPNVTDSSNSPVCFGDTLRLFANGGTIYHWAGPSGFSSSMQNPEIFSATTANTGTYVVSAFLNGCSGNPSSLNNVVVNALPIFSLGADTTICKRYPVILQPGGNYFSYLWNNGTTNNSITVSTTGVYSLTVTDSNGCKASDTIKIEAFDCTPQSINIFTPNGDGSNDLFTFSGHLFKKVHCELFDRWGRKIFEWNGPDGGWNGVDSFTNTAKPSGTYYYVAQITTYENAEVELKGFIELIR